MKMLPSYLRRQAPYLALLVVFTAVFALVFSLYDLPAEAVGYAAALCLGVGLVPFFLGLFLYARRHRQLQKLLKAVELPQLPLPAPRDALEQDYQALLQAVCAHRSTLKSQSEDRYRDMLDYYTLWAHQIKTPIAAAELLVQSAGAQSGPLAAELLKIEQYVEMVLSITCAWAASPRTTCSAAAPWTTSSGAPCASSPGSLSSSTSLWTFRRPAARSSPTPSGCPSCWSSSFPTP